MKIVTIIGARPQFIKSSVVSREIAVHSEINEIVIHTGQNFDKNMSDVFFDEMEIPKPKYNLDINSLSHGDMTGKMLIGIEEILLKEKPDYAMVYGDTNSTIAGALAAKKLLIKVIHVEAGLRSFNMAMPEEINRVLTDRISDILFCPTDASVNNLEKEGFKNMNCEIIKSGDVMLDAAIYYSQKSSARSEIIKRFNSEKFILCTLHRQENTDDIKILSSIIEALNIINKNIQVILPLHPRTNKILSEQKLKTEFTIIDPVGYFDMIELLKHCSLVMTDSGGLQKEAFFFKKNCVTLRNETEWVELVENGFNVIAGTKAENIINACMNMLNKKTDFNMDLYGDGNAAKKIVEFLISKQ